MGENTKRVPVSVLRNTLSWKQWLTDDIRMLQEMINGEAISEKGLKLLLEQHLLIYPLLNELFEYVTGDKDEVLFDNDNLKYIQEILPELDLSSIDHVGGIVEPMLEIQMDDLSGSLRKDVEGMTSNGTVDTSDESNIKDDEVEVDQPLDEEDEVEVVIDEPLEQSNDDYGYEESANIHDEIEASEDDVEIDNQDELMPEDVVETSATDEIEDVKEEDVDENNESEEVEETKAKKKIDVDSILGNVLSEHGLTNTKGDGIDGSDE